MNTFSVLAKQLAGLISEFPPDTPVLVLDANGSPVEFEVGEVMMCGLDGTDRTVTGIAIKVTGASE